MKTSSYGDISHLLKICEKEPIHTPGAIQPHGYLLAVDKESFEVKILSSNWEKLLDVKSENLLSHHISAVLGEKVFHSLQSLLNSSAKDPQRPVEISTYTYKGQRFSILLHTKDNLLILEMEPQSPHVLQPSFRWLDRYQGMQGEVSLQEMLEESAHEIRRVSGYDRVMIYKFYPDMHGEVVAEDKREDLESFLGLHYPATDIPRQARVLYLTNWTRMLVNVNYAPVSLLTQAGSVHDFDMSHCSLRSVSPVHVRYLQNMGVNATLTISLIYRKKLWGLVACHHYEPKFIDYQTRETCELIGRILSLHIPDQENEEIKVALKHRDQLTNRIADRIEEKKNFTEGLTAGDELLSVFEHAEGAAVIFHDELHLLGQTPSEEKLRDFIRWYEKKYSTKTLYCTSQLEEDYPDALSFSDRVKGLLLLKIHEHGSVYIAWFRPEYQHQVEWAGNPDKPVKVEQGEMKLSPRESFRLFLQTVKGKSVAWSEADITLARKFSGLLRDRFIDIQQGLLNDTRALFRMLYEQSADALFLADFHSKQIIDCNQRALEFFEVSKKKELIGLSGIEICPADTEENRQQLVSIKRQLLEDGEVSADILYKSKKESLFWGRFSAKILQGALQKMFVVRVTDISSSKEHEEELRQHNDELRKVNAELDRFVYSASHDLRAPITSLLGLLEIAKGVDNVAEMQTYLDMGKRSLNRLDHFIQEILDYSRNSRVEVMQEEVLLNVIIHNILDNYAYIEKYKEIRKEVEIKQDAPVFSDPFRLKVILNNLISNALRYSRPDQHESYIRIHVHADRDEVLLTVEDNGEGIPQEHVSNIFEMFYRADNRKAGSGLGLYIVKETLDKLQGKVDVASKIGEGTTMRIRIPNAMSSKRLAEDSAKQA